MKEYTNNSTTQDEDRADDIGDVETAGETTAAATISGPSTEKPVGADTMVKVRDAPQEDGDKG